MSSVLARSAALPPSLPEFLASYPSQIALPRNESQTPNYEFYSSERVLELQNALRGDWDELEGRHDYVQWLFPIREQGVNPWARPLQRAEIPLFQGNADVLNRVVNSYEIMLGFYGMRLVDRGTGELGITQDTTSAGGWSSRFRNLERRPHNFLRITRILKCLHELAHPHYVPPFLLFFLALQRPAARDSYTQPRLVSSTLVKSMDGYWRHCIRNDEMREWVRSMIEEVRTGKKEWGLAGYDEWVKNWREPPAPVSESEGKNDAELDAPVDGVASEPADGVTSQAGKVEEKV